jgi:hypothetical protein
MAHYLEIWVLQLAGTLKFSPSLYMVSFTFSIATGGKGYQLKVIPLLIKTLDELCVGVGNRRVC